jgi:hypothetical protein
MNCEICKTNPGTIATFIGSICTACDARTTALAKEKLKTWNLPRFDEDEIYCGICELNHSRFDTGCVQPDPDSVLIRYEDKHGV